MSILDVQVLIKEAEEKAEKCRKGQQLIHVLSIDLKLNIEIYKM